LHLNIVHDVEQVVDLIVYFETEKYRF